MTTIDQLTQDLTTAQAEIARLRDEYKLIISKLDYLAELDCDSEDAPYCPEEANASIVYITGWVRNRVADIKSDILYLSQSSPSLQEYRDNKP